MPTNTTDNYNREPQLTPAENLTVNSFGWAKLAFERASLSDSTAQNREFFYQLAKTLLNISQAARDISPLDPQVEVLNALTARFQEAMAKYGPVAQAEKVLALVSGNTPHIGRYSVFGDNQVSDKPAAINQVTQRSSMIGRNSRGGN